jgi:hypothetical protein
MRHRSARRLAVILAAVLTATFGQVVGAASPAAAFVEGDPPAYHGGYVQHHPKLFLLFWGPDWNGSLATERGEVTQMFQELAGSSYNNILSQYTDNSGDYVHNDVQVDSALVDTSDPNSLGGVPGLDLGTVALFMWNAVHNSANTCQVSTCSTWQSAYDASNNDTQFMVIPQPGTRYDGTFSGACGMHDNPTSSPLNSAIYSPIGLGDKNFNFSIVMPGASGCSSDIDWITKYASHEYAETATDPQGGGWYASINGAQIEGEVGDFCNAIIDDNLPQPNHYMVNALYERGISDCASTRGEDTTVLTAVSCSVQHTIDSVFQTVYESAGEGPGCPTGEWYPISGGRQEDFTNGHMYMLSGGTYEIQGAISADYYNRLGGPGGVLGYPNSSEQNAPGGSGRESTFAATSCTQSGITGSGSVILYSTATGAAEMQGCIYQAYLQRYGGPTGGFGYPVSNEVADPTGTGRVNYMAGTACGSQTGSALYWNGAVHAVYGCIWQAYKAAGETAQLGFPLGDEQAGGPGRIQSFQNGTITYSSTTGAIVTINGQTNDKPGTAPTTGLTCSASGITSAWSTATTSQVPTGNNVRSVCGLGSSYSFPYILTNTSNNHTATWTMHIGSAGGIHTFHVETWVPNTMAGALTQFSYNYCEQPGSWYNLAQINQNNDNGWYDVGTVGVDSSHTICGIREQNTGTGSWYMAATVLGLA